MMLVGYYVMIMRTKTLLASTVELQSVLLLPLGQTHTCGLRGTGIRPCYGTAPSLGRSQFFPLKRNSTISQVMERSHLELGIAQRDFSAWYGAMLIYPSMLSLFMVPHLSSVQQHLFALSGREIAAQRIPLSPRYTRCWPQRPERAARDRGELNGSSTSSLS